jgi:Protein of unknown function (DUF2490)
VTTHPRRHAAAVLAGLLLGALPIPAERAGAQESSEGSYELGLWKRVNSTDLLYVPLAITRKDEIDHAEGLFGVSYVWNLDDPLSVRAGYRYSWELTDSDGAEPYREHRLVAEANARPTWGARAEFMNRTRFELRWIDAVPSWRLRERILAGRKVELKHQILLTPYGTFEASFDSRYKTINRLRLSVGAATRFNSHVMLDTYFARQRDTRSDASQLQSFGMTLNLTY